MLSGYIMHLSTKYQVNPTDGLGGVHKHTHSRTDRGHQRNNIRILTRAGLVQSPKSGFGAGTINVVGPYT